MRKLASIVVIKSAEPVFNSDRLDVVTMEGKGWKVVTGRGEFKPGDKAVYFEIDSGLPADDQRYNFLHERCLKTWSDKRGTLITSAVRIRTVKLRGVVSQGLLMPCTEFPEITTEQPGDDLTALLHVRHCDEITDEVRAILDTTGRGNHINTNKSFPSFIHKTDEERIQNLADWPEQLKDVDWEVTEKVDGCSCTFYYAPSMNEEKPFGVCSRNYILDPDDSVYWKMAEKLDVEHRLAAQYADLNLELAVQGEIVGPGVNGNSDLRSEHEFLVFRIWDIKAQCFLMPSVRRGMCHILGLTHVPVISESCKIFQQCPTVDAVLKFAEGTTARGHEREGLVFKEIGTEYPRSFKAVSNRYLLKKN